MLRAAARVLLLAITVFIAALEAIARFGKNGPGQAAARAEWFHRMNQRVIRVLSVRVKVEGDIPATGLIVSNHLGYMDVMVLSAILRTAFVAKKEIGSWPIFGWCAHRAGTVFVDRERRAGVGTDVNKLRELLAENVPVVLFAEGTTSHGNVLLPFKPALLAAVTQIGAPVTPCALIYSLPNGSVATDVAYVGDDELIPHAWKLLMKNDLAVRIRFGESRLPGADRKRIAAELHAEVKAMCGFES